MGRKGKIMNKKITKIVSTALLGSMCFYTLPVFAYTKEESVYSKLDGNGSVYQTTVSNHLKNQEKETLLKDFSDLMEIENTSGNQEVERKNQELTWKAEGEDIYYQGKTEKELPIKCKIRYELDGKEISKEEIVGKSGTVKVILEFVNKEKKEVTINGKKETMYVPFVVGVGTILSNETHKNIEVTTGKVIDNGNKTMVFGMAMPGMQESLGIATNKIEIPSKVEMTMEVEDFEMGSIYIFATPKILEENDFDVWDELDELYAKMNTLQSSANQLEEGANTLKEGTIEFSEKSQEFHQAMGQMEQGMKSASSSYQGINAGIDKLNSSASQLNEGASKVNNGANSVNQGVNKLNSGVAQGKEQAMRALANSSEALTNGIDQIIKGKDKEVETIKQKVIEEANEGLKQGLTTAVSSGAKQTASATLTAILQDESFASSTGIELTEAQRTTLVNTLVAKMNTSKLEEGMKSAIDTVETKQKAGIDEINNHKTGVKAGLETLKKESGASIKTGIQSIASGFDTISEGVKQIDKGTNDLKNGTTELYNGTNQLKAGTNELSTGSKQMQTGLNTLASSSTKLSSANKALTEGAMTIKDGSVELSNGMTKFNQEGIKVLYHIVNGEVKDLQTRLETLQKLANEYRNFTMIEEEAEGSVKFIMMVDSLEKEETKEKVILPSERKESEEYIR